MAGTLLQYVANTQPDPLVASPAQGPTAQGALFVLGTNNRGGDVTLEAIEITLTIGGDGNDLSETAPDSVSTPEGWSLNATNPADGTVSYVFQPDSAADGVIAYGASLTFQFGDLQINASSGTCPVVVMEGSGGCTPPDCPQATLSVTKFPQGWQPVLLIATPPAVTPGQPTVLTWTGPANATYTLEYLDATGLPVTIPQQGQPALGYQGQYPDSTDPPLVLSTSTVFTLTASDPPYSQQGQVTVAVAQLPEIEAYEGQLTGSGLNAQLVLNWITQNATACGMTLVPNPVTDASPFGQFLVPSAAVPVLGSTMVLTATNGVGSVSAAVQVQWEVLSGASVAVPGEVVTMAAAPDGTLLVQTIVDPTYMRQETTLYACSPTTDAAAPYQVAGSTSASNVTGVAVAPGGGYVYTAGMKIWSGAGPGASSAGEASAFALDPQASSPLTNLNVVEIGSQMQAVAVSPDGTLVYMVGSQSQAGALVWTFQVQSGGALQPLGSPVTLPDAAWAVAVAPDGIVLVTCIDPTGQAGSVAVLAPTGDDSAPLAAVGSPVAVGGAPVGVAVSPDGERAFVAGQDGTVTLLTPTGDAAAPWQIATSCQTGAQRVQDMAMSPDGWNVMVCDYAGGTVIPVSADPLADAPSLGVGTALQVGSQPVALAFSGDGTRLVVAVGGSLVVLVPVSASGGTVAQAQSAARTTLAEAAPA
jgi:DNA-binding beta-propeller fold protein YncE